MLMLVVCAWWCNILFHCENNFHIIFNLAVLTVRLARYVFDVYIDIFDGSHDCNENMLN